MMKMTMEIRRIRVSHGTKTSMWSMRELLMILRLKSWPFTYPTLYMLLTNKRTQIHNLLTRLRYPLDPNTLTYQWLTCLKWSWNFLSLIRLSHYLIILDLMTHLYNPFGGELTNFAITIGTRVTKLRIVSNSRMSCMNSLMKGMLKQIA